MRNKLTAFIASVSNANEDTFLEELELLSDPDNFTKEDLGARWTEVIGYNPIDYHDEVMLDMLYDEVISEAPDSVKINLDGKKGDVIEEALLKRSKNNDIYLLNTLTSVIYDKTGWTSNFSSLTVESAIAEESKLELEPSFEDDEDEDDDDFILDDVITVDDGVIYDEDI